MGTLKRLMAQLLFGIDTSVGLGSYVALSFAFGEPAHGWFLLWALVSAYLPDTDFIHFLLLPKPERKWGHWRLGFHHPMIFLPFFGLLAWEAASRLFPGHEVFLTVLTIVCVLGHYLHDSTKTGLHWFSPITRDWRLSLDPHRWLQVRLTLGGLHVLTEEEVRERYRRTAEKSAGGAQHEIDTRIERVTKAQVVCFATCVMGFIVLAYYGPF